MGLAYKFDNKIEPSPNKSFGQTDSIEPKKINLGVNFGIMPSYQWSGLDYYAHFTIGKEKNFLAFGPIIGLKLEINYYHKYPSSKEYGLIGFSAVYQRHPNPNGKVFDFYYQNELVFHNYTDEGIVYINWQNQSSPLIKSYKSHQTDIADFIGYGCKIKFLKNFYINQNIGIGIRYSSIVIDYGDNNFNSNEKNTEIGLILKMGIGYTIDYKLKPMTDIDKIFFQN